MRGRDHGGVCVAPVPGWNWRVQRTQGIASTTHGQTEAATLRHDRPSTNRSSAAAISGATTAEGLESIASANATVPMR
jgi:hypothetical protein